MVGELALWHKCHISPIDLAIGESEGPPPFSVLCGWLVPVVATRLSHRASVGMLDLSWHEIARSILALRSLSPSSVPSGGLALGAATQLSHLPFDLDTASEGPPTAAVSSEWLAFGVVSKLNWDSGDLVDVLDLWNPGSLGDLHCLRTQYSGSSG